MNMNMGKNMEKKKKRVWPFISIYDRLIWSNDPSCPSQVVYYFILVWVSSESAGLFRKWSLTYRLCFLFGIVLLIHLSPTPRTWRLYQQRKVGEIEWKVIGDDWYDDNVEEKGRDLTRWRSLLRFLRSTTSTLLLSCKNESRITILMMLALIIK